MNVINYLDLANGTKLTPYQAVFNYYTLGLARGVIETERAESVATTVKSELAFLTGDAAFAETATPILLQFSRDMHAEGLDDDESLSELAKRLGLDPHLAEVAYGETDLTVTVSVNEYDPGVDGLIAALKHYEQHSTRPDVEEGRVFIHDDPTTSTTLLEVLLENGLCHVLVDHGQLNHTNVNRLVSAGYRHKVFERDSFGPLVCGVRTRKGWITYS